MSTMPTTTPPMKTIIRFLLAIVLAILPARAAVAQSYTLSPSPFLLAQNNSGAIINNACIWTYQAGTTTAATTYSDNAGTPNLNPIRSDSAGRFTAYLLAGSSYKFVYESACTPPSHGTTLRTADNISAVPASSASVDVTGTAGETISAGQCAYLSDGSASKTAGQWYKCDSGNGYSSTFPEVGIATNAILSAASGTIRLVGSVTGLSSLSVGSAYYVGAAGAITSTAPALARKLGVADSATTLLLKDIAAPTQPWANDFRLTLTTATPVTITDVTAATTIFASPLTGNRLDLPDASGNPSRLACAEFSIAVPATTSQMYDIFALNSSGACALEVLAWTNDTTRATAIIRTTTGRYYKTGDLTRLYVGSFRTTTVSGQTEDSAVKRYLWNYYNRIEKSVQKSDATGSWNYTIATWRQARADAANQVDVVQGIAESLLKLDLHATAQSAGGGGGGQNINIGIGEDSTTTPVPTAVALINIFLASTIDSNVATLIKVPAVGRHTYVWLEASVATSTTTFYGTNNAVGVLTTSSGLFGTWWC